MMILEQCVFQDQNIIFLRKIYYRLLDIGIFLFLFNYEKSYYNIEWKKNFLQTLSISYKNIYIFNLFEKECDKLFKNQNSFFDYNLYITMNSKFISIDLFYYKQITKNLLQMDFFHNLIDKIKCK